MFSAGREINSSHKARFFVMVLSISVTYIITDMYSANLTSLLARPGRGKHYHIRKLDIWRDVLFSFVLRETCSQTGTIGESNVVKTIQFICGKT